MTRAEADVMAGRSTALRLDWRTAIGSTSSLCPTAKRANGATALLIVFIDSASGGLARSATARLRATLDQLVDASRIRSSVNNRAISPAPEGWFIDCDRRPGERVELQFSNGKRRVDVQLGRLGDRPIELREVVVPVLDPKQ